MARVILVVKSRRKNIVISITERLPPVGARVIVVTEAFRCLGFLDDKGIWRHDKDSAKIEGVIGWHEFLAE